MTLYGRTVTVSLDLMGSEASEMVTIPRADLEATQAELRRLRRETALTVMRADLGAGPGDTARVYTREQLAEAWAWEALSAQALDSVPKV